MRVDPRDGRCHSCGGILEIIDIDDATMSVQCTNPDCGEEYPVEHDAFNDGAVHYAPEVMAEKLLQKGGSDESA